MQRDELSYAVRLGVVLKYVGQLCLVAAVLTLVPLSASLWWGDYGIGLRYALVGTLLAAVGAIGTRLPPPRRVQHNEALVIAAGMFVITSLTMTVPMMGSGLSFIDAWFESTSAVTTTGLSTTGTVEDKPPVFLLGRAWMQWYGGLGIVVLSLGLAMQPGIAARRLALTQSDEEDIVGGTRAHAQRVLLIYCGLTAAGIVALGVAGAGWFDAVVHCFAAVSTGGFSNRDDSLAAFSLPVQIVTTFVALAAAVSLPLYWLSGRRQWRTLLRDLQLWTLLLCGSLTAMALFGLLLADGSLPWWQALRDAWLNALSAQTTAGFSTVNIAQLDAGAKLIMIASMAIGGSTGSTAGGFKLLRLLIILRLLQVILFRTTLPKHAVEPARFAGRPLNANEREEALCVVALFAITVFVSWVPFVVAGFDPLDSLFEVVSATGTVGISAGISSPELPTFLKSVLCVDMLLGRVEFVALLVALYPRTWLGRRMQSL